MDVIFTMQFPLHTTTHTLVLEMVPLSSLMLTVVAGKIVSASVQRSPSHSFSVREIVCQGFFVAMVRKAEDTFFDHGY